MGSLRHRAHRLTHALDRHCNDPNGLSSSLPSRFPRFPFYDRWPTCPTFTRPVSVRVDNGRAGDSGRAFEAQSPDFRIRRRPGHSDLGGRGTGDFHANSVWKKSFVSAGRVFIIRFRRRRPGVARLCRNKSEPVSRAKCPAVAHNVFAYTIRNGVKNVRAQTVITTTTVI